MISGIELANSCVPYFSSSLAVMFSEKLVWRNFLDEERAFPQPGAEITILHVQEWEKA